MWPQTFGPDCIYSFKLLTRQISITVNVGWFSQATDPPPPCLGLPEYPDKKSSQNQHSMDPWCGTIQAQVNTRCLLSCDVRLSRMFPHWISQSFWSSSCLFIWLDAHSVLLGKSGCRGVLGEVRMQRCSSEMVERWGCCWIIPGERWAQRCGY